ncbi:barstar family protein [Roseibium album]|uniref:Barstar (barnase inhibitor) domain-containing protein n=1 Tax=Roseibium album TaxID=311410 RepID=A0A0M7AZJ2_9HYPH|nr:barstar family protein [Roseibium album]CTQ62186.1 hypothetical protein LA5094_04971 [Roseibium album]CTQ78654.1 hypothetical protein LA5096_05755 [Roseibium album]CTQ79951.1 hypothetical protein LA5095_05180 [Roseibium album]
MKRNIKGLTAGLSPLSRQTILQVESLAGAADVIETVDEARRAQKFDFDGNLMRTWPELVEEMGAGLGFQSGNNGYDFVLAAYRDCMRDVIDDHEAGVLLVISNAGRLLNRDRKYSFSQWVELIGDVALYAGETITDGQWWDRGPRYFKVILEVASSARTSRRS